MGRPVEAFALAQDNAFHELIHAGRVFNQASIAVTQPRPSTAELEMAGP